MHMKRFIHLVQKKVKYTQNCGFRICNFQSDTVSLKNILLCSPP